MITLSLSRTKCFLYTNISGAIQDKFYFITICELSLVSFQSIIGRLSSLFQTLIGNEIFSSFSIKRSFMKTHFSFKNQLQLHTHT